MPQLEQGDIKRVSEQAEYISKLLVDHIDKGADIITLVPSCSLMLKSEWPLMIPSNENIKKLAKNTFDIDEYIVELSEEEGLSRELNAIKGGVSLHLACHSRAQNIGPKASQMLKLIPDTKIDVIEKCSGHGGSWGVKKENFDTAFNIGKGPTKTLLSKGNKYVSSTCPLAAEHIVQIAECEKKDEVEMDMTPRHPIEILAFSYGLIKF